MSVTSSEYLYIERWGQMMGSNRDFIADEVARARRDKAPPTAIYRREDGWRTIEGVTSVETRHYFTARGWMTRDWEVPLADLRKVG